MCHSPVLRHGDGSAVHLTLRGQGDANWAWLGCVAPRQAESEVLVGSEEGAKIVVGNFGNFVARNDEEFDSIMKSRLSVLSGPVPGMSESVAANDTGKQIHFPQPGSDSGGPELGVVHRVVHAW